LIVVVFRGFGFVVGAGVQGLRVMIYLSQSSDRSGLVESKLLKKARPTHRQTVCCPPRPSARSSWGLLVLSSSSVGIMEHN
jgi:hypothetical protein